MRVKIVFLIPFLMGFVLTVSAQKKPSSLKALKLKSATTAELTSFKTEAFTMNQGVLRPAKGYELKISGDQLLILPRGSKVSTSSIKGATSKDLGGGITLNCIGCSNCQVTVVAESKGRKNYGCGGECPEKGCTMMVSAPSTEITQSLDGNNWQDW